MPKRQVLSHQRMIEQGAPRLPYEHFYAGKLYESWRGEYGEVRLPMLRTYIVKVVPLFWGLESKITVAWYEQPAEVGALDSDEGLYAGFARLAPHAYDQLVRQDRLRRAQDQYSKL